ncbi:RecF/RecN/SMC amine-terminal domain protein [Toxoplasma gondii RUB]|uniref:RecF/RecN/SMC amine-terminal domain protein n=1 Tax=Toxoplasma gondii RUB TaxID=935652 RepID=A0A086M122_TOXGO|nr:RecF/RecN/SMC amine-terminal domain protein [Toxoplasma gondii RUB]
MSCQTSQEQRESLLRLQATLHEELAQERSLQLDAKRLLQEKEVCKLLQKQVSHAGVHGTALECCRPASKRLTVAVAAALGPKASSLLVDSHALALKCIEYLKTARLGSCEFLPIETLRQKQLRGGGEDTEEEEGGTLLPPPPADALPPGCRWAVDCVSFEDRFRHVYQFLLSDCLIVPSLAVARELRFGRAHASVEKYRLVTLDGEKLQRGGVIAFDLGGLTGRLAARWEAQQQDRLLERVEKVREQLQALEHAEVGVRGDAGGNEGRERERRKKRRGEGTKKGETHGEKARKEKLHVSEGNRKGGEERAERTETSGEQGTEKMMKQREDNGI